MAIDTADKRAVSMSFGRTFAPIIIPDGSIDLINRITLLGCYYFVTEFVSVVYVSFQLDINQSIELELIR